jgi:hypothetical protein
VIYCYIILIYLLTSKIKLSESCIWFQCFSKWFSSFWTNLIVYWMMCQCVSIYKEIYWVIYCYIILIYLLTVKIKLSESCVWFQCFSKWFSSFWINLIPCWMMCQCVCQYIKRYIEWYIVILYWFIYAHLRLSWMRVVFDFNASASDSAPFEPILLPVEWCVSVCEYIKRYIEWYIAILYWFIYLPQRSSSMRVGSLRLRRPQISTSLLFCWPINQICCLDNKICTDVWWRVENTKQTDVSEIF